MNKLIIVIALAAACIALAEANKFGHRHHGFEEGEFNDFDGIHDHGHLGHFRHGGRHGRYHGRRGHGRHGHGHRHVRPHGFHKQGSGFGAFGGHHGDFQNTDFDHNQGGLIAGGSKFDNDHHVGGHSDVGSIHKHQGFNKDKTFIKDHESGVNDVDGFHNSQGFHEGDHHSGAQGGIAAGGSSTHLGNTKASDTEVGAIGAAQGSSSGFEV